jgi:hypothetical protein
MAGKNKTKKQEENLLAYKNFLEDLLYFKGVPTSLSPILEKLLYHKNFSNKLFVNSSTKKIIAIETGLSVASVDKAITKFVQAELLIREDRGYYTFSPLLLGGAGEITLSYSATGRKIKVKQGDDDQLKLF